MDKYSDVDIEAMLKRIHENAEKSESNHENKSIKERIDSDSKVNDVDPDNIINLIMADIGKKGETLKQSSDMEMYDISGFEIENSEDSGVSEKQQEISNLLSKSNSDDVENLLLKKTNKRINNKSVEKKVIKSDISEVAKEEQVSSVTSDSEVDIKNTDDKQFEKKSCDKVKINDIFCELSQKKIGEINKLSDNKNNGDDSRDSMPLKAQENDDIIDNCSTLPNAEEENEKNAIFETSLSDDEHVDFSAMSNVTDLLEKPNNLAKDTQLENDPKKIDYLDMNVAISLGAKDTLEATYGCAKVREAKHNFIDSRKKFGSNAVLNYNHNGKEYRDFDQNGEIKDAYRKGKKRIGKRLIFISILFIVITFLEAVYLETFDELMLFQFRCNLISSLLFFVALLVSAKKIFYGIIGFFTTHSNYYTVIGFVSMISFIYDIFVLTAFRNRDMITLNSVTTLGILIIIIGEYMQISREIRTFELVSDEKTKLSLENVDISNDIIKKETFLSSNEFVIENANFVGKYFERSAKAPQSYNVRHTYVTLTMLLSLFVAVFSVIFTHDFVNFVFVIELSSLLCVPVQFVFAGTYAFYITSKKMLKFDSAIIGETFVDEYVGTNIIYLDDIEVFGKHGVQVVNLEPLNNFNVIDVNYYYLSVFSKVNVALKNAFGDNPPELKLSDNVEILNVFFNGIEALVDTKNKILIGKADFLHARGIKFDKNFEDKHSEKRDVSLMYIAVNGALCARIYLKYNITHYFEKFVEEMVANGSLVGIRTIDPNVTTEMISNLHGNNIKDIKVMRPTRNDLISVERRSDSGIITEKNPHMIARILAEGLKIKKINSAINILWIFYSVIGFFTVLSSLILKTFDNAVTLYIILYQIIWSVGIMIYTKYKLRNGNSK